MYRIIDHICVHTTNILKYNKQNKTFKLSYYESLLIREYTPVLRRIVAKTYARVN